MLIAPCASIQSMFAVLLVQAGLVAIFLSVISFLKPMAWLGISTRRRAALVFACGVLLFICGSLLPAREYRAAGAATQLDRFVPTWQFNEVHSIHVNAPAAQVFTAIQEVTADEIFLYRMLTWIRRFGRPSPESILNAPGNKPVLLVATQTSFLELARTPAQEIVIGTLVAAPPGAKRSDVPDAEAYRTLAEPGFAKAGMNFWIHDNGKGSCVVSTETRVFATSPDARRRFAIYWRIIYPGSAFLRRSWLRAIRQRAEAQSDTSSSRSSTATRASSREQDSGFRIQGKSL
jgi:hypothetical protein